MLKSWSVGNTRRQVSATQRFVKSYINGNRGRRIPLVHVSSAIFTRIRDVGMRPFNDLFSPGEKPCTFFTYTRFSMHYLVARQLFGIVRF